MKSWRQFFPNFRRFGDFPLLCILYYRRSVALGCKVGREYLCHVSLRVFPVFCAVKLVHYSWSNHRNAFSGRLCVNEPVFRVKLKTYFGENHAHPTPFSLLWRSSYLYRATFWAQFLLRSDFSWVSKNEPQFLIGWFIVNGPVIYRFIGESIPPDRLPFRNRTDWFSALYSRKELLYTSLDGHYVDRWAQWAAERESHELWLE